MAKLIFHEALHNKLKMEGDLHKKGGLAQASLGEGTAVTDANIKLMAGALGRAVPQWTGGFKNAKGGAKK